MHPLDIIIDWLGKYPKARVADFGCGEARLAATVPNKVCLGGGVRRSGSTSSLYCTLNVSWYALVCEFGVVLGSVPDETATINQRIRYCYR